MGTCLSPGSESTEILNFANEDTTTSNTRGAGTPKRSILTAMKPLRHLVLAIFLNVLASAIMLPALVDVTIEALCPKQNQCSEAIYISGFQQSITGFGKIIVTPLVGQLSDEYGRKPLLLVSLSLSVIPYALLACSRTKGFVYAYYVLRTLVAIVSEGAILCVSMAYVADVLEENFRANAFGMVTGIWAIAFVIGTVLARVLTESAIFQVGCIILAVAVLYVQIFLGEPNARPTELLGEKEGESSSQKKCLSRSESSLMQRWLSIKQTVHVVRMSEILTKIAIIAFFSSLGESGMASVILYYFKATFSFNKNEFASLLLIFGVSAVFVQLALLPILLHLVGEHMLLSIALFSSVIMEITLGVASSPWIPYFCAFLGAVYILVFPCASSIVSRAAGPREQGKVQGFVAGIQSFASTLSPLAMSPLTALFLSEDAPFNFPGFSMICAAVAMTVAFIQSCLMRPSPPPLAKAKTSVYVQVTAGEDMGESSCAADYFVV